MINNRSLSASLCRLAAATLFAAGGTVGLYAQQGNVPASQPLVAELHQPALFNPASSPTLFNLSADTLTTDGIGYSSSVGSSELASAENFRFNPAADEATQPPPRRRYGRPNYSDRMHNSDGSSKIAFLAGAGFTAPTGDSTNYLKFNWKAQVGLGYNFNKKVGVVLQFDYDNFALPGSVITNQTVLYGTLFGPANIVGLDGHTHIWSFTLNPTYYFYQSDTTGAYAVVGGGFYHKVTDFTLPTTGEYCDPYYGYCYQYQANATFDQYVSNSAGVNGGIGFTWKPSRFASERLYAEARYVHTFNTARPGDPATPYNYYPGNSATTSYVPVTFGIRF